MTWSGNAARRAGVPAVDGPRLVLRDQQPNDEPSGPANPGARSKPPNPPAEPCTASGGRCGPRSHDLHRWSVTAFGRAGNTTTQRFGPPPRGHPRLAGCLAGFGRWDQPGLAGMGGSFRSTGRGEAAGDGNGGWRTLSAEGVGEQIDEGIDGDGVVIGVVGDQLLPAVGSEDVVDQAAFDDVGKGDWLIWDMRT